MKRKTTLRFSVILIATISLALVSCSISRLLPSKKSKGSISQNSATVGSVDTDILAGCTKTIGYWKNHSSEFVKYLPQFLGLEGGKETLSVMTEEVGVGVLTQTMFGEPNNGITKLYAQLLATKFNIASGASDKDAASVILLADTFLSTHDYTDWADLAPEEQTEVLSWKTTLDQFNNGIIGPGHCGDTPPPEHNPIHPILECVSQLSDNSYRAYFGYKSDNDANVSIPIGLENHFTPDPEDRGQPTTFAPGSTPSWPNAAYYVDFDGASLAWTLDKETATASKDSPRCSFHVFFEKKWYDEKDVQVDVPAPVPGSDFQIVVTSDLGNGLCTYSVLTTALTCEYFDKSGAATAGLLVEPKKSYTVAEASLPINWMVVEGNGTFSLNIPSTSCIFGYQGLEDSCLHSVKNKHSVPSQDK